MYHVEINQEEGYIQIARHSRVVLYWEHTELEDSEVVFAIANAINLALTNPVEMDKKLIKLGVIKNHDRTSI